MIISMKVNYIYMSTRENQRFTLFEPTYVVCRLLIVIEEMILTNQTHKGRTILLICDYISSQNIFVI